MRRLRPRTQKAPPLRPCCQSSGEKRPVYEQTRARGHVQGQASSPSSRPRARPLRLRTLGSTSPSLLTGGRHRDLPPGVPCAPDLAALPARKPVPNSDSLRARAAASQAMPFFFLFSVSYRRWKSLIAEGMKSYMFLFCAAVGYFKVFFEWEKILSGKKIWC